MILLSAAQQWRHKTSRLLHVEPSKANNRQISTQREIVDIASSLDKIVRSTVWRIFLQIRNNTYHKELTISAIRTFLDSVRSCN